MGRSPSKPSSEEIIKFKTGSKGVPWSAREDQILINYINFHGEGRWTKVAKQTGLVRSGKSCRLRWMNYLRPDIKRGNISDQEEDLIIRLHKLIGNRWSLIAGRLPGRTDNEIKNYWNTILTKKKKEEEVQAAPKRGENRIEKSDSITSSSRDHDDISSRDHDDMMINNEHLITTCSRNSLVTESVMTADDISGGLDFTPNMTENVADHVHGRDERISWDLWGDFHDHADQFYRLSDLINNFDFSKDFLLD